MAQITFADPGVDRFQLHDRLGRELVRRGHRVEALLVDRAALTFWRAQGTNCHGLAAEIADPMQAPIAELAAHECARRGLPAGSPGHGREKRRVERRLARLLPAMVRWLSVNAPDLLLLHGSRTAERRLLHFVGRELGQRVLWTGDGLLPHTMQVDERGLDADAATAHRDPFDYRQTPTQPELLDAALAHLFADSQPSALSRREIQPPRWQARTADALHALLRTGPGAARRAMRLWHTASETPARPAVDFRLPDTPFCAVLLQDPADERVRLDAPQAPSTHQLTAATMRAARALEHGMRTLAVLPDTGLHHRELRALLQLPGLEIAPASAAASAAATAVATTTINHPMAIAALLAGSPVLHTGQALYGLPSVTDEVPTDGFATTLRSATAAAARSTLRTRFLSWLIGQAHLWCSTTHPDHNGLTGLVQEIEARLGERRPRGLELHYRSGPAWPLSPSASLHSGTRESR